MGYGTCAGVREGLRGLMTEEVCECMRVMADLTCDIVNMSVMQMAQFPALASGGMHAHHPTIDFTHTCVSLRLCTRTILRGMHGMHVTNSSHVARDHSFHAYTSLDLYACDERYIHGPLPTWSMVSRVGDGEFSVVLIIRYPCALPCSANAHIT